MKVKDILEMSKGDLDKELVFEDSEGYFYKIDTIENAINFIIFRGTEVIGQY